MRSWPVFGCLVLAGCIALAAFCRPSHVSAQTAPATDQPKQPAPAAGTTPPTPTPPRQPGKDLLDLDLEDISRLNVRPSAEAGTGASASPAAARVTPTASGSVLSATESAASAGGGLGELLNQAPSVNVHRTTAITLDPRIRGFNSSQLNASTTGMTQLKTRIDIDSLFSQIAPGIVDNVTVIDGPYSSLYGPGFAFLVADLLPAPRFVDGPQAHGAASFSNNSNGRQIATRENVWGGGPDWGVRLSWGLRSGGEYLPGHDSNDFRVPASYRQQDVFFSAGVDLTAHSRLEFQYIHQNLDNVELPGVTYDLRFSNTEQFNVRFVLQEDPKGPENAVLQFWNQRTGYAGDSSRPSKHQTFYDTLIVQPFPELNGGITRTMGFSDSTGVRGLLTFGQKDAAQLTLGADYRRQQMSYQERDFLPDGTLDFQGTVFGIPRSSLEDAGLFIHFVDPITPKLNLTVGARYDHTKAALDANDPVDAQTVPPPNGTFRAGFDEPTGDLGMGYAALEYKAFDWLKLSGGVAFAMRPANLTELYSMEPFSPIVRFGNSFADGFSDLRPERDLQFDLGVNTKWDRVTLGGRAFYSTIYDYILPVASNFSNAVPAGTPNVPTNLNRNVAPFGIDPNNPAFIPNADTASLNYRYTNLAFATLYGGEAFGEVKVLPWLAVNGTLAYVKGVNSRPVRYDTNTLTVIPIPGSDRLPNIYPLNSTIGIRIFEPRKSTWSVEFLTRMVAGQRSVAVDLAELPTPGFTVFGLTGNYHVGEHLRLFTSIDNLFDRSYFEHSSLAIATPTGAISFVREPGFSWVVGFELHSPP